MTPLFEWFKDAGHASLFAAFVSLASLVVAVGALLRSSRAQSRVLSIEEAREADRRSRANKACLVGRIGRDEGGSYWLEIENVGEAEARAVEFTLDGKGPGEHPALEARADQLSHCIGSGATARYLLILTVMERPPYELRVTWADASEEPGEFRTTLTI